MKRLLLSLTVVSTFLLAACQGNGDGAADLEVLRVGASSTPHSEILEFIAPMLVEEGIDLQVTVFQDFVLPNLALHDGELDANYFQHVPYLTRFNAEQGTDIVPVGGVHVEPIGIYSSVHDSLDDLPQGARIIMSNSVSDHGRLLALLQYVGLITLDPSVVPANSHLEDIIDNPLDLQFEANVDPGMLVQAYRNGEGDAVLINTNFALDGGLNPMQDAIAMEDSNSPFVNVVAVNAGNENDPRVLALVEALHSEAVYQFILDTYQGAVVPAQQ